VKLAPILDLEPAAEDHVVDLGLEEEKWVLGLEGEVFGLGDEAVATEGVDEEVIGGKVMVGKESGRGSGLG